MVFCAVHPSPFTILGKTEMFSFDKLKKRWAREAAEQSGRSETFRHWLMEKGKPVFRRYHIQEVYIFGSVAAGGCRENSDVDLYVTNLKDEHYWQFRHELEEAVQLPIDLYTDSDDPVFVQKIVARGEKIYGVSP